EDSATRAGETDVASGTAAPSSSRARRTRPRTDSSSSTTRTTGGPCWRVSRGRPPTSPLLEPVSMFVMARIGWSGALLERSVARRAAVDLHYGRAVYDRPANDRDPHPPPGARDD